MIFFRNDYGEGCIEPILDLIKKANEQSNPGYGEDKYCRQAADLIRSKMVDFHPDIHFVVGGTLANLIILKHLLRPYEGVISCDTGHINVHETGAVEAIGHKIITVPNANGKLTCNAIRHCVEEAKLQYAHMVMPKVVYISNATELGTVYTRKEMEDLRAICDELGLYLFMDGARLGSALMSGVVDYSLNDLSRWCDVYYIGGTKNGALFGEAIVIPNEQLKPYFRFVQKQTGGLLAKGWLLGIQFIGLFENDDFYKCAKHANDLAKKIQDAIIEYRYPVYTRSCTNQVFFVASPEQYDYLRSRVDFEVWDRWRDNYIIRLVTSWHTKEDEVEYLIVYLKEASQIEQKAYEDSSDGDDGESEE